MIPHSDLPFLTTAAAVKALSRLVSLKSLSPISELRLLDTCKTYAAATGKMSGTLR